MLTFNVTIKLCCGNSNRSGIANVSADPSCSCWTMDNNTTTHNTVFTKQRQIQVCVSLIDVSSMKKRAKFCTQVTNLQFTDNGLVAMNVNICTCVLTLLLTWCLLHIIVLYVPHLQLVLSPSSCSSVEWVEVTSSALWTAEITFCCKLVRYRENMHMVATCLSLQILKLV